MMPMMMPFMMKPMMKPSMGMKMGMMMSQVRSFCGLTAIEKTRTFVMNTTSKLLIK
jgi:hypothetical protein